jgi:hypothetical protein
VSLLCILILSISRVDKAPENPEAGGRGRQRPLKQQTTKVCCEFFQNGFSSSDIRQYSGSLWFGSNLVDNYDKGCSKRGGGDTFPKPLFSPFESTMRI